MRINTNIAAMNTLRVMAQTDEAVTRSIGRLSSGFRINRAADDAAGLAIANQLRADLGALRQATRNAEQAGSLLKVAEGGMQGIEGVLERMKELASQAASDNVADGATGRDLIDAEYQLLIAEIDRIASSTEFADVVMLDGTAAADLNFIVGITAGADTITLSVTSAIFDLSTDNLGTAPATLDLSDVTTSVNASAAITAIDEAIGQVSQAFAQIGAQANRLDIALTQARIVVENTQAAESVIRDADMAAEITELTKNQILAQAGISVLAQANVNSQSVLALLQ
ncbi:MAG: flagellin [Gemmatimonadetes bacterium]|nr:flagellin [Gemmatimonadota bacterium]